MLPIAIIDKIDSKEICKFADIAFNIVNLLQKGLNNLTSEVKTMNDVKCIKIKRSAILPGIIFILSVFYLIMPDNIIPDTTIMGWTDDFFIITAAFLYLLEKILSDHMNKLKNFVKKLKAVLIIAGTIAVAVICIILPDLTNIEKVFELYIKQIEFCPFCI